MYWDIKVDESIRQVENAITVFNVCKSPVDWFSNIVQRELSLYEQAERRRLPMFGKSAEDCHGSR